MFHIVRDARKSCVKEGRKQARIWICCIFSEKSKHISLNQSPKDYWDSSLGNRYIPVGRCLILNSLLLINRDLLKTRAAAWFPTAEGLLPIVSHPPYTYIHHWQLSRSAHTISLFCSHTYNSCTLQALRPWWGRACPRPYCDQTGWDGKGWRGCMQSTHLSLLAATATSTVPLWNALCYISLQLLQPSEFFHAIVRQGSHWWIETELTFSHPQTVKIPFKLCTEQSRWEVCIQTWHKANNLAPSWLKSDLVVRLVPCSLLSFLLLLLFSILTQFKLHLNDT